MVRREIFIFLFSVFLINASLESEVVPVWEKPGCHKIGHTRKISIPDCVEFRITTNACRGYCESWSIPSTLEIPLPHHEHNIRSLGQCCNIIDTEDVTVHVMCLDGIRKITFKSAVSCSCYHCKRD